MNAFLGTLTQGTDGKEVAFNSGPSTRCPTLNPDVVVTCFNGCGFVSNLLIVSFGPPMKIIKYIYLLTIIIINILIQKKNIIRKKTMKKSRLPLNKHFLNLKVHYWLVRFFQYFYKNIYSAVHKVLLNLVWLFKFELTYHKLLYLKLLKQITIYLKFKNLKFIGVYFFYIFLLWFVFQI